MIHVITGPPCAGKSTYVRTHAKRGDLRVDYDTLAAALGCLDRYAPEGLIKQAAFAARESAILEALKDPDSESWIIHTSPTGEHLRMYEQAGAEFVELDPGYEECMARALRDERPQQTIDGIEQYYSREKGLNAMERKYKEFALLKLEDTGKDAGRIAGYFSTYDRIPDSYGDVIAPGAFTDTIKAREESGHPFPLCWNHDLNMIIGKVDSIEDTEKGPLMTASFFDTPLAQEKREIVKSGVVYQFSFAYNVIDQGPADDIKANELRKLDLFEISIVPIPANQNAVMTEVKAGKRNSKADEAAIRQAIELLQGVLGELEEAEDPEGEDEPKANGAPEEPEASNPRKEKLLEYIKNMKEETT